MSVPIAVSLIEAIKGKLYGLYPSTIGFAVDINPGETIESYIKVPKDYVYANSGVVCDVPVDVFEVWCEKDGTLITPKIVIDGTSMTMNYAQTVVVEDHLHSWAKNVSGVVQTLRMRFSILVIPRWYWEQLKTQKSEITLLGELKEVLVTIGRRFGVEFKS
jgi:hypothetical protein